ncbi:phosphate regulon sensor histidine kinase PhoR [Curvibacter sp. CHRR-16]|uniref:phosphate regulon sensor histidine kinase PhoR n=1 Tax=Curvibacter sp. CHRR-16 TaxID=2835872 RepID=UPI001BDADCF9|nr:phosphate regulon sensor histidine kinase PhoR [Curvibacter sp. CHRR-16]MBT0568726.1 phosphate regulon sensor histidine kinase PhoR [Curvibacter sp. CHRR-16]
MTLRILAGRLLTLLLWQLVAAGTVYFLVGTGHWAWMVLAVVMAGVWWLLLDVWKATRLLRWLRRGALDMPPAQAGVWGEAGDRVRRLMRERERELQTSDARLQDFLAAMQASPNGVVLLDAQGRIEWFNQMAANHFGLVPQRDLLQHLVNLVRDPVYTAYSASREFDHEVVLTGRVSTPSKPVRLSVHMHPYGEGRSLLLSRDITALEQAEAMRRDFVANVSHEIRTPLTVLSGFVETLQSLPLEPNEQQHYLGLMAQQAQRMQTLVSDLLVLSRLEGSPVPGMQQWMRVDAVLQLCEQEAAELGRVLWGKPHPLVFDCGPATELAGVESELHSAIYNLIGNAVRYTPVEKTITVRWQRLDDGSGLLCVQDEGPGIAPEHIPRLTERFYRVDRSRSRDSGGTGLGLAIVKHVAQRHGAELRIDSVVGQGSVFSLLFPAQRVRNPLPPSSDFSDLRTTSAAALQ